MAKPKPLWSALSDRQKARYKRHGVTPQMYNSVKKRQENKDLFLTAQGRAPKSYMQHRAESLGLSETMGDAFGNLTKAQQREASDLFMKSFYTRNAGIVPDTAPGREFKFGTEYHPDIDKGYADHSGWVALSSTVATRMDFMQFLAEHDDGKEFSKEDWERFRELYRNNF